MKPAAWRRPCMQSSCSRGEPMSETYTLACCRSPDTSVRVTVTALTRGSRNSNRMVSLATSRTTSATRASRCAFMASPPPAPLVSLDLKFVVEQFRGRVRAQRLDDLAQRPFDRVGHVTDHRKPQDGEPVIVLGLDL